MPESTRPPRRSSFDLEDKLDRELDLPRDSNPLLEESVEVEQQCRRQGIDVVSRIGRVEHLDDGEKLVLPVTAESDRPLQPPVEREELVVLTFGVSSAVDTFQDSRFRGDGLCRTCLDPDVRLDRTKRREAVEVEFVPDIAIGETPIL